MKNQSNNKSIIENLSYKWAPVLIWGVLIWGLSSISSVEVTKVFFWDFLLKKSAHVVEYFVLFTLVLRATNGNWAKTFTICILYAASDEFHQSFVPGRTASALDIIIDISGMNIAAYIIWKFYPRQFRKQRR